MQAAKATKTTAHVLDKDVVEARLVQLSQALRHLAGIACAW